MVSPQITQILTKRSQERISHSEDFAKLLRNIERYKAQKEKKVVPLNEEEFFAQRAELDADKEEEKQLEDQALPSDEVIERTFYFNEVLAIASDYVRLLEQNRLAWVR
jgi:carboxyl-terminal processing protease